MDSAKDLLKNKEVGDIVKKFFGNKSFYYELTSRAKEVVSDGKLDIHDIPDLVYIASMVLNKSPNLQVPKNLMKPLLKMIVIKLLVEVEFLEDKENPLSADQEKMLDGALGLLDMYVHFNTWTQWFADTLCCCVCNNNNDQEEHITRQKEKRNSIIKQNEASTDEVGNDKEYTVEVDDVNETLNIAAVAETTDVELKNDDCV